MKRVWHINSNRWNSAITEYSLSSAKALTLSGWENIYSGLEGKPAVERAMSLGLSCFPFKNFGLGGVKRFRALKKAIKPDIIIVYGGPETSLCRLAHDLPIYRFKGQDADLVKPVNKWRFFLGHSHVTGVITPAVSLREKFLPFHANTTAVPLGCDTKKFFFNGESRGERPVLTIVGRLDPVKGHATFFLYFSLLLKAWASHLPRPLLRVIGEPANISVDQLFGFAEDVGLITGTDWELIPHRLPDIREAMATSTIGVVSSLGSEVICRVAEEFVMCGVPIFVSGAGSLEECLIEPTVGYSYRGQNGREIAASLQNFLVAAHQEDTATRQRRAALGKSLFSWQSMGQELTALFSQLGPSHFRGLDPSAAPIKP